MNQLRQPFSELSPEVYKGLVQASIALEKSELGNALVELVYLRVSQINGCAFCLEKHSQALRKGGMAQSKLDALAGWRVSATLCLAPCCYLKWKYESCALLFTLEMTACSAMPPGEPWRAGDWPLKWSTSTSSRMPPTPCASRDFASCRW